MLVNPRDGYLEKRIIFSRADGRVTVRLFRPWLVPEDMTEDDFLAIELVKASLDLRADRNGVLALKAVDTPIILVKADLPTEYEFRDAWTRQGNTVVVDLNKAKVIQAERVSITAERAARKATSPAEKSRLRNLAENLNAATAPSIAALKAKWPLELPKWAIRPA